MSELSKIRYVPDVGDVSGDASAIGARRYFGVSPDSFVVLVYGSLGERKGVRELLVAARQLKGATVCVLLAGTQSGAVKRLLDDPEFASMVSAGELIVSPGFQSRELEQLVFAACDAVWVGYVGGFTGSSGVLYQAGSVAVPVIATRAGLIGWITRRHQVGLTVEPTNCSEVIAAIERLRDDRELCAQLGQNGQKLARRHSPQQFGRRVCNAIAG